MKQPSVTQLEHLFRALADRTRLRILGLLLTGEVCVCHLHESLRIPQSKASRHLAYLRRAGLVDTRRQGLWIYYRLSSGNDPIVQTIRQMVAHTLGHVDVIRRDQDRLHHKTGCCAPNTPAALTLACCGQSVSPTAEPTTRPFLRVEMSRESARVCEGETKHALFETELTKPDI